MSPRGSSVHPRSSICQQPVEQRRLPRKNVLQAIAVGHRTGRMGIAHPTLQALLIIMGWLDLCRPRCYAHLITFRQTRKVAERPRKNKASLPIPILRLISGVKRLIINDAVLGRYWAARHAGGAYNGRWVCHRTAVAVYGGERWGKMQTCRWFFSPLRLRGSCGLVGALCNSALTVGVVRSTVS